MEGSTIQNWFEKVQAWHECVRATRIGQHLSCTFDDYFRFHPHKEILCTTEIMWKNIHHTEKLYTIASMGRFHFNWMASLTRWTCVWVNSGSWWWTGRPGVLRSMGSQRVGHDWVTELNWTELIVSLSYITPSAPWYVIVCFIRARITFYLTAAAASRFGSFASGAVLASQSTFQFCQSPWGLKMGQPET